MIDSAQLRSTLRLGLIAGAVAVSLCMIGVVQSFNGRDVITGVVTLGRLVLFLAPFLAGFYAARRLEQAQAPAVLTAGLLSGLATAVPTVLLIALSVIWPNIRQAFINVSPALLAIITFGQANPLVGALILAALFAALGLLGGAYWLIPERVRSAVTTGLVWSLGVGVMAELAINILRQRTGAATISALFGQSGIRPLPFVVLFVGVALLDYWQRRAGRRQFAQLQARLNPGQTRLARGVVWFLLVLLILVLPSILGIYLTEIINNVGLYILMGLGLNIAVGLAGLLDLGYVTNFAVGAYVMALLTSTSTFGLENPISFWIALPICVLAAMLTGFVLALPVLRMRGDYLAITTLGFGEIIRVLARSDWLKEIIGGAQGILQIPAAAIEGVVGRGMGLLLGGVNAVLGWFDLSVLTARNGVVEFGTPNQLYYLLVLACLLMLFVSRRLNNSRIGRSWMALREDEDVANAVGINTTTAKVIAFTLSAASGGMAGAIFAAKIGSIYPHSFQLLISINVLALIIVGGLGSIPGVVVGAFALVGVPELLREFNEYRLLMYGIALILMMLVRPEGLWPSDVLRRELADRDGAEASAADRQATAAAD